MSRGITGGGRRSRRSPSHARPAKSSGCSDRTERASRRSSISSPRCSPRRKAGLSTADGAVTSGAAIRGRIGMLGHDLFLYPELTARENLTFFAHLYGVADVPGVVSRALERAGLADRADDLVSRILPRHAPARRARAGAAARSAIDPAGRAVHRPRSGVDRRAGRATAGSPARRLPDRAGHTRSRRRRRPADAALSI